MWLIYSHERLGFDGCSSWQTNGFCCWPTTPPAWQPRIASSELSRIPSSPDTAGLLPSRRTRNRRIGERAGRDSRCGPSNGIGKVVAQSQFAGTTGRLERLKMCAPEECRWIFFDRSTPASRRWCSPVLCGNRERTRAYRRRRKAVVAARRCGSCSRSTRR